jgi:hypothetical protein
MSREERIRFLMRIARRVEGEGDERAAELFRRMADDARPLELDTLVPSFAVLGYRTE